MNEKPTKSISHKQYKDAFAGHESAALRYALEIRRFEIELYWKRAAYFWAFIVAAFVGFGVMQEAQRDDSALLSIVFSCLGLVFSIGWYCVNRGSKFWQENWENHVDLLEDTVIGPLYKTVISRPEEPPTDWWERMLAWPGQFSVSKVNQIVSAFVVALWLLLSLYSIARLTMQGHEHMEFVVTMFFLVLLLTFVIVSIISIYEFAKTDTFSHENLDARTRDVRISCTRIDA